MITQIFCSRRGLEAPCLSCSHLPGVTCSLLSVLAAFEYIFVVRLIKAASFEPVGFGVVGFSHLYFILVLLASRIDAVAAFSL